MPYFPISIWAIDLVIEMGPQKDRGKRARLSHSITVALRTNWAARSAYGSRWRVVRILVGGKWSWTMKEYKLCPRYSGNRWNIQLEGNVHVSQNDIAIYPLSIFDFENVLQLLRIQLPPRAPYHPLNDSSKLKQTVRYELRKVAWLNLSFHLHSTWWNHPMFRLIGTIL